VYRCVVPQLCDVHALSGSCVGMLLLQTLDATLNALNPLSYEFASLNFEWFYNSLKNIGPQEMSVIKHVWREVGLSRWLPEPPTHVRPLL
jgi:hypothetical protein